MHAPNNIFVVSFRPTTSEVRSTSIDVGDLVDFGENNTGRELCPPSHAEQDGEHQVRGY